MKQTSLLTATAHYRADIDGLRSIAVLAVLGFHAAPGCVPGGFVGVDIFFVISGYLISGIIAREVSEGKFSYSSFYSRRVRRIFPALLVVAAAALVFGWLCLLTGELQALGVQVAAGLGFSSNLLFWSQSGYFDDLAETKPLLHLWSLGVEEQYYIIWPIVVTVIARFGTSLAVTCALLASCSFLHCVYVSDVATSAAYYSPLSRFWEIACGSLLAACTHTESARQHNAFGGRANRLLRDSCSIAGLAFLAFSLWLIDKNSPFPGPWALLPTCGTSLLIYAGPQAAVNRTLLSSQPAVWCGLISYPLYLWHWPLLSFAHILEDGTPPRHVRLLLVGAAFPLAWATARWVERPVRFSRTTGRVRTSALVAASAGLLGFGIVVGTFQPREERSARSLPVARKGTQHIIGGSPRYFRGTNDWLFLGNYHNQCVAKLTLAVRPQDSLIDRERRLLSSIASACGRVAARPLLLVGPNKASIYPEFLPSSLRPSPTRYLDQFFAELGPIEHLTILDPTNSIREHKNDEWTLYYRSDTHWNARGAYIAFAEVGQTLGIDLPVLAFDPGAARPGDLARHNNLDIHALRPGDNWEPVLQPAHLASGDLQKRVPAFGEIGVRSNPRALSTAKAWVVGDSFTKALRPYFEMTFAEVDYRGHWRKQSGILAQALASTDNPPDVVIMVRVERSF